MISSLARARDGIMCRYSYLSGACANKHVDSLDCIGLDKCEFSGMNIMTSRLPDSISECGHEKWLGLYCEKYKRFFCPGREHCVTPESYQKNLIIHEERRLRMIEEP
jgi:hypothetical protein